MDEVLLDSRRGTQLAALLKRDPEKRQEMRSREYAPRVAFERWEAEIPSFEEALEILNQ